MAKKDELQEEIRLIAERNRQLEESIQLDREVLNQLRARQAAMTQHSPQYSTVTKQIEELTEATKIANAERARNTSLLKQEREALKELEGAATAGVAAQDKLASAFTATNTGLGNLIGQFASADKNAKTFAKGLISPSNALKNLGAVGTKVIDMFADFGIQQDKVLAQFRATTGAGDEFNATIRDTALEGAVLGVTLEEAADATQALKNEFTDFTYLNTQQQLAIAKTVTTLGQLGFSAQTQASILQGATQTLGMSLGESNQLLLDLTSTARSLGVDVNELGVQFNDNLDFIVRFGEDGQEVFEELAVAAKALGTELGTLVKVTDQFKNFDEAGRIVGRFNAILGGPFLNSIDMLNAAYEDPIEGIKMLREGFDAAGRSIEEISGAELQAVASALGLTTSETVELLGKSNEELEIQRMNQEQGSANKCF